MGRTLQSDEMVVLKKIKANTLVEVLVSSVIISVLLAISTLIILNLSKNTRLTKINRNVNELNESFYNELHVDKVRTNGEFNQEISIKKYKDSFQLSVETESRELIIRHGYKE